MTAVTVTQEPVDLDALEVDAQARLAALREQRQRLAPEALIDSDAASELADVESEIRSCVQTLERMGLARQEQARREAAQQSADDAARRGAALTRARELQRQREQLAERVDEGLRAFAEALAAYCRVSVEQEQELRKAGSGNASMARHRSWRADGALRRALRDAAVPNHAIDLPPGTGELAVKPFAEMNPRAVEAEGAGDE